MHAAADLILLFEHCFFQEFNTLLRGGATEPVYLPGDDGSPHKIIFTRDYFASALHEVAHWCVAGPQRRAQPDYGYWYAPDGRTAAEQVEFERVEVKPQALEWLFSTACRARFRLSADNLSSGLGASDRFRQSVAAQAQLYCAAMPERPRRFMDALANHYGAGCVLDAGLYRLECLE